MVTRSQLPKKPNGHRRGRGSGRRRGCGRPPGRPCGWPPRLSGRCGCCGMCCTSGCVCTSSDSTEGKNRTWTVAAGVAVSRLWVRVCTLPPLPERASASDAVYRSLRCEERKRRRLPLPEVRGAQATSLEGPGERAFPSPSKLAPRVLSSEPASVPKGAPQGAVAASDGPAWCPQTQIGPRGVRGPICCQRE